MKLFDWIKSLLTPAFDDEIDRLIAEAERKLSEPIPEPRKK